MSHQMPMQGGQPAGSSTSIPVLAVAAIIIVFLAGLMIVLVAGHSGSDLEADLDSVIVGEGGIIAVSVYGNISNTGDQAAYGIVTIRVWDGSGWQTFEETTELIQPQDSTYFVWADWFEGSDASEFEVKWSVAEA